MLPKAKWCGIINEGHCYGGWATLSLHQGGVQIHRKEERWLTQVLPVRSTQVAWSGGSIWFSIATTMDELPKVYVAPVHAVSRVKWLLSMITVDRTFVSKADFKHRYMYSPRITKFVTAAGNKYFIYIDQLTYFITVPWKLKSTSLV